MGQDHQLKFVNNIKEWRRKREMHVSLNILISKSMFITFHKPLILMIQVSFYFNFYYFLKYLKT